MKFAIVLLGLVALAAAAPEQRSIIGSIENLAQGAVTKAHSELDKILANVKVITSSTQSKAGSVIAAAKNEFGSVVGRVESTVNQLLSKAGSVRACALTHVDELTNLKNTAEANLQACSGNLVDSAVSFEQQIAGNVAELKSSVSALVAIVNKCTEQNLIDASLCAALKIESIEELTVKIVSEAKAAVEVATNKATTTVAQIEACAKNTVALASAELQKFTGAINQCV